MYRIYADVTKYFRFYIQEFRTKLTFIVTPILNINDARFLDFTLFLHGAIYCS